MQKGDELLGNIDERQTLLEAHQASMEVKLIELQHTYHASQTEVMRQQKYCLSILISLMRLSNKQRMSRMKLNQSTVPLRGRVKHFGANTVILSNIVVHRRSISYPSKMM